MHLLESDRLGAVLSARYGSAHAISSDKALYRLVMAIKNERLRSAEAIDKVTFDSRIHVLKHALGTHTAISRVQGGKLKAKREIRVASLFRAVPMPFLEMIVVHELAHVRHVAHDKAFYQLCRHLQPDYHQVEFDLRLYLTYLDSGAAPLWRHDASVGNQIQIKRPADC
ncbi:MAG: DUF45 domain-containing protein [Pseudomonadota bacterium]|nr:DUF45 domain-containing protein [Pseudomonadota bacterium]